MARPCPAARHPTSRRPRTTRASDRTPPAHRRPTRPLPPGRLTALPDFPTLTNGQPIGVAEAVGEAFVDVATNGRQSVDWVGFLGQVFDAMLAAEAPAVDYGERPTSAEPPRALDAYAGTYGNSYYGPLVVTAKGDSLSMIFGPASMTRTRTAGNRSPSAIEARRSSIQRTARWVMSHSA